MKIRNSFYIVIFIIILILSLFLKRNFESPLAGKKEIVSPDNNAEVFIPKGLVLVPVELVNSEAIGQLLGGFGYINLYTSDASGPTSLILSNAKLLQAPLNPTVYAVLVTESEAQLVMSQSGPYRAVLLGKEKSATGRRSKKMAMMPQQKTREKTGKSSAKKLLPTIEVEYSQSVNYE